MVELSKLPPPISGPAAWIGADMTNNEPAWLVDLSVDDINQLETAAHYFLSLGRDISLITAADFPLGPFTGQLQSLQRKLLHGVGVEVLRGLPIEDYDELFAATIFCGIGTHLGSARSQNSAGDILGHVRNMGASSKDVNSRIYQTAERQSFHTDSADVVGLLCIKAAKEGGQSLLVSALSLFNRMRDEQPDLLRRLFDPIATDRRGEVPKGAKPYMQIPVLNWHANELTVFYQRQYIDSAQRFSEAPRLSRAQIAALDRFDELANDPEMHFSMQLQPGDMQFVYNHTQLHDRTAFVDWPDSDRRRHLLRLWLSLPGDRPLPDCFKERYGSIEIGNRGGIIVA